MFGGKRELSYNFWRYRLLHWTFGVDPPKVIGEATVLPPFLYTHYCPLFHFTNFLVLIFPIVFLVKMIVLGLYGAVIGIQGLLDKIPYPDWQMPELTESQEYLLIERFANKPDKSDPTGLFFSSFELFWHCKGYNFKKLSKEQVEIYFNICQETYKAIVERRKQKKEVLTKRITGVVQGMEFITGHITHALVFSGIVLWAWLTMNLGFPLLQGVIYVLGLAATSLYANGLNVLMVLGLVLGVLGSIFTLAGLSIRYDGEIRHTARYVAYPFSTAYEFFSILYENNCPKIEIAELKQEEGASV